MLIWAKLEYITALEKYDQSTADNEPYETIIKGETTPTFPHKLSS